MGDKKRLIAALLQFFGFLLAASIARPSTAEAVFALLFAAWAAGALLLAAVRNVQARFPERPASADQTPEM